MELVIVPVAHVSAQSVRKVSEAIRKVKPDYVAVELDPQRLSALMHRTEPTLRDLAKNPFFAILYLFQKAVGKGFRITPGSEMLAAVRVARELKIPIALIDQNIAHTMGRLRTIPLTEKLAIISQILLSPIAFIPNPFRNERLPTLEEMTEQKFLGKFFREFRQSYPGTYKVLVEERDEHMFHALLSLKAERVVLIVGAGHVPGLLHRIRVRNKTLPDDQTLHFSVGVPRAPLRGSAS